MNRNNTKMQIVGILSATFFISRSFYFPSTGDPSYLIWGSVGIFILILFFLTNNKYSVKIFFTTSISVMIFSGLMIVYTYLLLPMYASGFVYYFSIGIFLMYTLLFALGCLHKWDPKFLFGESFE
ncbi:hypothetical protein MSWAN_0079 [Methanobacterium paludis]|uniref:Uncharacterized protein n=1 Tax=Methanobacterium paludis (strain DSM 25820 / JCM 18151 / SWAN1) TaxID=868131 RepID=F6D7P7_METPW|nr:hypothetical protein MSWAN_0079 [Methanobacterium paludis]